MPYSTIISFTLNHKDTLGFSPLSKALRAFLQLTFHPGQDKPSWLQIDNRGTYYVAKIKRFTQILSLVLDDKHQSAYLNLDNDEFHVFYTKADNENLIPFPYEEIHIGDIGAIYRNLRENYEYGLRYDDAGKFFVKEMELKRK